MVETRKVRCYLMMARFTVSPGDRISNSARTARSEVTVLHADPVADAKITGERDFLGSFFTFVTFPFLSSVKPSFLRRST